MGKIKFKTINSLILDGGETEVVFQDWDESDNMLDLSITGHNGSVEKGIMKIYMYKDEWEAFKRAGDCIFKEMSDDV